MADGWQFIRQGLGDALFAAAGFLVWRDRRR
jgi:hypothetical protein